MEFKEHCLTQIEEALGDDNRWYASEYYGYQVTDPEILIEYYIKHGGAEKFASKSPRRVTQSADER